MRAEESPPKSVEEIFKICFYPNVGSYGEFGLLWGQQIEETPFGHLGISKLICVDEIHSLFPFSFFSPRWSPFVNLRPLKGHQWGQEASNSNDERS